MSTRKPQKTLGSGVGNSRSNGNTNVLYRTSRTTTTSEPSLLILTPSRRHRVLAKLAVSLRLFTFALRFVERFHACVR
jgi:hypothetical protein